MHWLLIDCSCAAIRPRGFLRRWADGVYWFRFNIWTVKCTTPAQFRNALPLRFDLNVELICTENETYLLENHLSSWFLYYCFLSSWAWRSMDWSVCGGQSTNKHAWDCYTSCLCILTSWGRSELWLAERYPCVTWLHLSRLRGYVLITLHCSSHKRFDVNQLSIEIWKLCKCVVCCWWVTSLVWFSGLNQIK